MAIPPPSSDDLARIARQYGFALSPGDLESFRGLVTGALGSYEVVQRLYSERLPEPPDRQYSWPDQADNELGAWYVTTDDHGRRRRPAGRAAGGGEGQHRGRRAADDERIGHGRGVRATRATPPSSAACWPPGRRSPASRSARTCASPAAATLADRAGAQPVGPVPVRGRVIERQRGTGRGRAGRPGARRRPGRLDPHPERLLRHGRAQAHLRTGAVTPARSRSRTPRPPWPDHRDRPRRRAAARRAGRARTGWTTRQRAGTRRPAITWRAWTRAWPGCGSASSRKGSPSPASPSPRWTRPSAPPSACWRRPAPRSTSISVPWHRDGLHVWNVIATDGVVGQMIDGNGYGMNIAGLV